LHRIAAAIAAVALCASLWVGVGAADAAPGDLTYQGCLTGDTNFGPVGTSACPLIPGATATGTNSGLDELFGISASPDGTSVYALSHLDDAIARFNRDPSTGAITYQGCISGRTETTACTQIASAKSGGANSGLDEPYGITISPNGASVYVAAQEDDSIATFSRDTSTGALTYQRCITGEQETGPAPGNGSCTTATGGVAPSGTNSGIDKVRNLAVDANGESLYSTSGQDDAIARFSRDPATGTLVYGGCFTAEAATGTTTGTSACTNLPGISVNGSGSGFDNPQAVTVSPSGASVYVGSGNDAAIDRFSRTAGTGLLAWQDCLTRDLSVGVNCAQVADGTATGTDSGFDNIRGVAVSQDGTSLYAVAGGDSSIIQFSRDTGTGALGFQNCITGESQIGPGGTNGCGTQIASATPNGDQSGWAIAGNGQTLVINQAGSQVLFGTGGDDSVVQLDRNTSTGALSFRRCLTSETESTTGCAAISPSASFGTGTALDSVFGLALSPDGGSVYTTSFFSDAVARFAIEPAPVTNSNPPVTSKKSKKCKKHKKHKKHADASKKKCKKKKKRK
jgi:hypothetical protein